MYVPNAFAQTDVGALHRAIRAYPLGSLVTWTPAGLDANHLPFLVDSEPAPFGTLRGHVARANPVWRDISADVEALVIFHGPDAFVSPTWYPSKSQSGKVVPTWNYVVVHAHGRVRVVDDAAWVRAHVEALTREHEAHRDPSWAVTDAPAEYIDAQVRSIVGIEIPISRLLGKWKASQNRSEADRSGAIDGLEGEKTDRARVMASVVRGEPVG